jgi:hypothetical protein
MTMGKLLTLVAVLAVALSLSGMVIYSAIDVRVRLNPEIERLTLEYLRDQEQRREYGRKVDAANKAAEQNFRIPIEELSKPAKLDFSKPPHK